MALKVSKGNMYPWVTHKHTHLGGRCPHECIYCYIDNPRFGRPKRYEGELRLIENELRVNYGSGKTIFIENCNDLFADGVSNTMIVLILAHCHLYPDNTYVFQTKNPKRYFDFLASFPPQRILGTTIETNRFMPNISKAPKPYERARAMWVLLGERKFITIEPVLDFDVDTLAEWIADIDPEFLNLGADSKNHHLPEPSQEKIFALVDKLKEYEIELREKHNLQRLKEK